MQKRINKCFRKIFGTGCEPETMLMDATRALAYFGLGVTLTGLFLINTVWIAGFILTSAGFFLELYYWKRNKNKKRNEKR